MCCSCQQRGSCQPRGCECPALVLHSSGVSGGPCKWEPQQPWTRAEQWWAVLAPQLHFQEGNGVGAEGRWEVRLLWQQGNSLAMR
jgi:hypothetical protein